MLKRLFLIMLALQFTACAALQAPLAPLKVSVKGVTIEGIDLTHAHLVVDLNVRNPNGIGLDLQTIDYVFAINGVQLIEESLNTPISIAANDRSEVKLPVQLSLFGAMKILRNLSSQASHSYTVDGSIKAKRFPFPIKFEHSDVIDLESARKNRAF